MGDLAYPEKYDVIVLCAEELQPEGDSERAYRPTRLICAPNDDSGNEFSKEQATIADVAARQATKEYAQGRRILVSCAQGRNRSGLVMALILHRVFGMSGEKAIRVIRAKVPTALTNQEFVKFLLTIEGTS